MKGPCPKCDVIIEMPGQEASAAGSPGNCPECKQKYWIHRESFMLRAYKKQGRVYCFNCGSELGSDNLCRSCGSLCPDYCVVQSSKPVVRKQQKVRVSFRPARRPKTSARARKAPAVVKTAPAAQEVASSEVHKRSANKSLLAYAALAVMLLILVGGMTKVYLEQKVNQKYAKDFIVALYGIKSGADLSLGAMDAIATEWQNAENSLTVAPRPSKKDLDRLTVVKTKINTALSALDESPEKFADAKKNLMNLHRIYGEIYALNTSMPGSPETLTESLRKLEADFFKTAKTLKNSMPEELQEELQASVAKYRNLRFMVDES